MSSQEVDGASLSGQLVERPVQGLLVAQRRDHVVTALLGGSTRRCRWVCITSALTTTVQAWGLKQVPQGRDLWLDLSATRCWVRTAPVAWSRAARR